MFGGVQIEITGMSIYNSNINIFLFSRSYDSLMVSQNMVSNKVHLKKPEEFFLTTIIT